MFAAALKEAGAATSVKLYQGKTHTDPIIEVRRLANSSKQDSATFSYLGVLP